MHWKVLLAGMVMPLLVACMPGPKSASGFRLPDGDAEAGRRVFVEMECHHCHLISGLELPRPSQPGPVQVRIGGEVTRVQTYGELVSSIINPSHKIASSYPAEAVSERGQSLMKNYNQTLTVQQLIDLVAFLQSRYKIVVPEHDYRYAP